MRSANSATARGTAFRSALLSSVAHLAEGGVTTHLWLQFMVNPPRGEFPRQQSRRTGCTVTHSRPLREFFKGVKFSGKSRPLKTVRSVARFRESPPEIVEMCGLQGARLASYENFDA